MYCQCDIVSCERMYCMEICVRCDGVGMNPSSFSQAMTACQTYCFCLGTKVPRHSLELDVRRTGWWSRA